MKAIAVLRVSTDTQEIEGQKRELVAFAKEHGYGDRDLIYVEAYIDGLIDRKNRDLRLSKIEDDIRVQRDRLTSLQAKRRAIAGMLEDREKDSIEAWLGAIAKMDQEDMFQVIHQHCEKLVARQVSFGKRDPRTRRPNAVEIVVTSIAGGEYKFMYIPKYYQAHNLYIWSGKWVPDRVTTIESQI